jgi:hypothetical protein
MLTDQQNSLAAYTLDKSDTTARFLQDRHRQRDSAAPTHPALNASYYLPAMAFSKELIEAKAGGVHRRQSLPPNEFLGRDFPLEIRLLLEKVFLILPPRGLRLDEGGVGNRERRFLLLNLDEDRQQGILALGDLGLERR